MRFAFFALYFCFLLIRALGKRPYRLTANGLFEEAVDYLLLSLSLGKT
jgi:hypothetical protein